MERRGLPQHFLTLLIKENRTRIGLIAIEVEDGEFEREVGSGGIVEDEVWGRRSGEEGHSALGGETPSGETKAFSPWGDRGYGDAPHFPPFPCFRHADVDGIARVT